MVFSRLKKNGFGNDMQNCCHLASASMCWTWHWIIPLPLQSFIYIHQMDIWAIVWKTPEKLHFIAHVIIRIILTRCIHGNNMCSRPIYWLCCLKRHFSIRIWYPTKWLKKCCNNKDILKLIVARWTCQNGPFLTPYWCHQSLGYLKKICMPVVNIQWCPWTLKGLNI